MKKLLKNSLKNVAGGNGGGKLSFTIADGATVEADSFVAIDNFKEQNEFTKTNMVNKKVDRQVINIKIL